MVKVDSEPKFITFRGPIMSESGKTKIWVVETKTNEARRHGILSLGAIKWYSPWRKYAFLPHPDTVFEQDCLTDIATFCRNATKDHNDAIKMKRGATADSKRRTVQVNA